MERPPRRSRPHAPGYFLPEDEGNGLLPWDAATTRLAAARNYWLATTSRAGLPHAMPVWGVWLRDRFLFSTGPHTRKGRNLTENPFAVVHLESGSELVVVEGAVRQVSEQDVVDEFLAAYNPKYGWSFTPDDFGSGGLYEIRPSKAFVWSGDEGEAFSGTATRFVFDDPSA
jgi:hypothetical protein